MSNVFSLCDYCIHNKGLNEKRERVCDAFPDGFIDGGIKKLTDCNNGICYENDPENPIEFNIVYE